MKLKRLKHHIIINISKKLFFSRNIFTDDGNHSRFSFNPGDLHPVADGVSVVDQLPDDRLHLGRRHVLAAPPESVAGAILNIEMQ